MLLTLVTPTTRCLQIGRLAGPSNYVLSSLTCKHLVMTAEHHKLNVQLKLSNTRKRHKSDSNI